jgi:predicted AAA+ superfamily ATPase
MLDWKNIILQNPWWQGKEDYDISKLKNNNYSISRKSILIAPNKIYLIKGPRRVGKTIFLKKIAQENPNISTYINFDTLLNVRISELIKTIEHDIKINNKKIILLDEIQSLKEGCLFLKSLKDLNLLKDVCVIVTGSDPRAIDRCKQYLIGRSEKLNIMAPLTFRQYILTILKKENLILFNIINNITIDASEPNLDIFKKYKLIENYFEEINDYFFNYLLTGGFPEAINSYFEKGYVDEKYYEDIVEKIFEKMDKSKSISILKVIIDSLSGSIKYSTIEQKTGYSRDTIKSYLETLSELLVVFEVKENSSSILKKFYIKDPFIIHSIANLYKNTNYFDQSKQLLFNEQKLGVFAENIVASHLHNLYNLDLSYYNVDKKEIDFIVLKKAIEVKYRNTLVKPNYVDFIDEYLILSKSVLPPGDVMIENRLVIPVCIFLSLLEVPKYFL